MLASLYAATVKPSRAEDIRYEPVGVVVFWYVEGGVGRGWRGKFAGLSFMQWTGKKTLAL